jgi:hypothetical protein
VLTECSLDILAAAVIAWRLERLDPDKPLASLAVPQPEACRFIIGMRRGLVLPALFPFS